MKLSPDIERRCILGEGIFKAENLLRDAARSSGLSSLLNSAADRIERDAAKIEKLEEELKKVKQ